MSLDKKSLILVVDDMPENCKLLGNLLKEHGYNPAVAPNGQRALDFVKNKKPDLILLDIMMPELDGFQVCKQLKQDISTKEIPIIFLTAKVEKDDIIRGLELGAVDYVDKPFNEKELITRVNTHIALKITRDKLHKTVEALQEANATQNKFFSIISHDLGNIFSGLIGLADLLSNKNEGNKEFLVNILQQSTQRGYNLLKNLLDWSRLHTGKIKPTAEFLCLKEFFDKNMMLLAHQAQNKNIILFSFIDKNVSVFADGNMVNTVIRNLLSNAIKFTPENGKVEMSAKQDGDFIEILVSDTGVGIKKGDIEKLFKVDVSHSTIGTAQEQGTGLGLILCKDFVESNRGNIWVESELGKGSQFYFRLPGVENLS
jgi:signal transduction histidine kinase